MVRWHQYEPSTLEARITEGSVSRTEPSTLEVNITDGSISRAEPSTLDTEIVEGSISQALTIHAKCLYHGRFETIEMYIGGFILPSKYPVSGENVDFLRKKCRKICRVKKSAYICSPFEKQRWLRPTDDSADLRSLTTLRENKR